MNIFLIDTEQCSLDKLKVIHEYLSTQLDEIIILPINNNTIEMNLKCLLDFQKEKERLNNGINS